MRFALALVVPVAAALLQGSIVPLVEVAGTRPNLPVLVAGAWSLAVGAREATWWAFLGGLASDLLSGGPLGALALASLPAVAAIGIGDRTTRPVGVPAGATLIGAAAFVAAILYVAILALVGVSLPPLGGMVRDAMGGALYTAALALLVYPVARAARRLGEQRSFA